MKRFLAWIGLKERLHSATPVPPLVSEGDIWWASLGENVGSEINGKSSLFSRPVVILLRRSDNFRRGMEVGSCRFDRTRRLWSHVCIRRARLITGAFRPNSERLTMRISAASKQGLRSFIDKKFLAISGEAAGKS